ncbi:hypothetical protein [Tenacibaculum finnmarkense]|uniref:hypothetical protein n=1 Tax=Tenacibaculum finnmarkense TaxID=2781243 RepID=UPI001EFBFC73|nr:hypothetical protein [Tenacibaculum finnmarkense]MCG8859994.1 hypothetical protein [Tenacibaculum finnmarkense]
MNENVYKVLNGFIKLSEAEKTLFINELNKYQSAGFYEKQNIYENVKLKSSVGPKNTICTCCGR